MKGVFKNCIFILLNQLIYVGRDLWRPSSPAPQRKQILLQNYLPSHMFVQFCILREHPSKNKRIIWDKFKIACVILHRN